MCRAIAEDMGVETARSIHYPHKAHSLSREYMPENINFDGKDT